MSLCDWVKSRLLRVRPLVVFDVAAFQAAYFFWDFFPGAALGTLRGPCFAPGYYL